MKVINSNKRKNKNNLWPIAIEDLETSAALQEYFNSITAFEYEQPPSNGPYTICHKNIDEKVLINYNKKEKISFRFKNKQKGK